LQIPSDQNTGVLKLAFANGPLNHFNMPLTVRATARVNGKAYTAERQLTLVE